MTRDVTRNLLRHVPAKNYQNRAWFDKVIAKINLCSFLDSREKIGFTGLFLSAFKLLQNYF